jgi:hypothetical protein
MLKYFCLIQRNSELIQNGGYMAVADGTSFVSFTFFLNMWLYTDIDERYHFEKLLLLNFSISHNGENPKWPPVLFLQKYLSICVRFNHVNAF